MLAKTPEWKAKLSVAFYAGIAIMTIPALFLAASVIWLNDRM